MFYNCQMSPNTIPKVSLVAILYADHSSRNLCSHVDVNYPLLKSDTFKFAHCFFPGLDVVEGAH